MKLQCESEPREPGKRIYHQFVVNELVADQLIGIATLTSRLCRHFRRACEKHQCIFIARGFDLRSWVLIKPKQVGESGRFCASIPNHRRIPIVDRQCNRCQQTGS